MAQTKPKIFLGSATETKQILDDLEGELRREELFSEVIPWNIHFKGGEYTLEGLQRAVGETDFAAFILGQDDRTESRGKNQLSPRDNVVFEAGLFTAKLGLARTFYVVDKRGIKIPSDWAGVTCFEFDVTGTTSRDRVYNAVKGIMQRVKEHLDWVKTKGLGRILGDWWQYVLRTEGGDEGSVISLFSVKQAGSDIHIHGYSLNESGRDLAQYRSQAAAYDLQEGPLSYYWTGEHPRKGLSKYYGVGEVYLGRAATPHREVSGQYSVTTSTEFHKSLQKFCNYERAPEEEVALFLSSEASSDQKKALIERLTKRWRELREQAME